ncbi:MAG: hypothetical protein IJ387_03925, partial [Thermoguttaceae bacterium]|nr:hypothetical protein [Thermoguttaceae bacterium]
DVRSLDSRGDEVGQFFCRSLLEILRARRRTLGSEVVYLQEFAAYFALVEPSLFSTVEAFSLDEICGNAPDVSQSDAFSARVERRPDVEIVRQIDADAVRQKIVAGFQRIAAPPRRPPFSR